MRYILLLLLVTYSLPGLAQANNTDPLRQKTITLRRFLEQNHYQPLQWNDSASARLYDHWLELLDDDKLIFSKKEITQLTPYRTGLDEEMMGKQWSFFNKSVQLYKTGLLRADSIVKAIMLKALDFSKADDLRWPLAEYTADNIEISHTWQQYLKWKVLRTISDGVIGKSTGIDEKEPPNFAALEIKAREQIKKQELQWIQNKLAALEPAGKEMEDRWLSAITWCYDPHTEYM
ncbi:MAG: hypothetical protein ABIN67_19820, partial [Ferruginibacter sp.]